MFFFCDLRVTLIVRFRIKGILVNNFQRGTVYLLKPQQSVRQQSVYFCCTTKSKIFVCLFRSDKKLREDFNEILFEQKLAALLYQAAADASYVDTKKVEDILRVSPRETTSVTSSMVTKPSEGKCWVLL